MENNFLSAIFKPTKKDALFNAAMSASQSLCNLLKLDPNKESEINHIDRRFRKIYPKDKNSPSVYWMSENQYIVYYPINSTPYKHKNEFKCKFVEILRGVLYDKNSDKKFFRENKLIIQPSDNYEPYTTDKECYIQVCISDCDTPWSDICQ